ncbi:alcohol dehydrogenase [Terribacillus saccharophilus]|uniref:Alcohol dehydrogenase n=1 Tax=Terribacillus saccharophilus TaxID=361277 RepID=A0A268H9D8_9BACI|nr:NAD(P)-dependent alcohol dehydrogenase [Terribacillus saccharophilus]PAD33896.1 alcohol dehydrogenase [Terribacillus saccharophilus]PAD94676.1 alcohol dehydrogenase [Terribacillus saccharophilus]PAD98360.1 alcohol dehydrogenase [Terribacillus saccharophilus]PAE06492.1 alcohol dehydrogenase [Terribacillus saccharophilus]
MKAITTRSYGSPSVLKAEEVPDPVPKGDELLIKVHAASLNQANLVLLKGKPFLARFAYGVFKPKHIITGSDISGVVKAAGKQVKHFKPGDEVYADLSNYGFGSLAEYVAVPEKALALKPTNLSHLQASAVPLASLTALQALRDAVRVQPGQRIMIYGSSGGVGTFAVQVAKAFGATVTAVCSKKHMENMKLLGADYVLDYGKIDLTKYYGSFDAILAINGYQHLATYKKLLTENGVYVMVGGSASQMFEAMLLGPIFTLGSGKKLGNFLKKHNTDDLVELTNLIEADKIRPLIDRVYPFQEFKEAFTYLDQHHAYGKVIITIQN